MAFTSKGASLLNDNQIKEVNSQIKKSKLDFENDKFSIPDVFSERVENLKMSPVQDYDYCPSKDIICVIEGEQRVFTCCTLTGDLRGLMGSIENKRFKDLWNESQDFRKNFDVRANCTCCCLYEQRNKSMLEMMKKPLHVNFI